MENYLLYLLIVAITVASPGPGVILTLSNAIRYGAKSAMLGVFGISFGILIIAVISATSLGVLLSTSAIAFSIVKYLGAAYLMYLGIKLWRSPLAKVTISSNKESLDEPQYMQKFREGFMVSLLNPKPIFFFMSLFPQFISHEESYLLQFSYLTFTFCMMILIIHSTYVVGANLIKDWLLSPRGSKIIDRVAGTVFVLFGFGLATSER